MPAITVPQTFETAGTIVTNVRDMIPDPIYNNSGVAQPDSDGSFVRAQTLYRFITSGVRDLCRRTNWTCEDWWAMPLVAYNPIYSLDSRWHEVESCFVNQYWCTFVDEVLTIYPAASSSSGSQSLTYGWHKRTGGLDISLWVSPAASDPTTTLNGVINSSVTTITVTSSTNFLTYGWLMIDNELIQYYNLGTNQVSACVRGCAGTTAASHSNGATVYHLGLWVKGKRSPNPVTAAADLLEIPVAFCAPLEHYVLARVREMENDRAEAKSLMQDYIEECNAILTDPVWQNVPGRTQVAAYGSGFPGVGIYPLGPFGTYVP